MADWHAKDPGPIGSSPPPVMVAHGTSDVVIPPENADALAARWPDCRVERFAGGGHACMAQDPVGTAAMIESFVAA
jgi:pimeloyl-ACP methyl ester carboxylesterase